MLSLIKPGIILGNLLTAFYGYWLVGSGTMPFGIAFVIAAACLVNNYIDQESDQKMERTKHRPKVSLWITVVGALGLCGIGVAMLPWLAAILALLGFVVYVGPYSFLKYHTRFATLVGSVAGAVPPLVGYAAATGTLQIEAFQLAGLVFLWQMPHFYAIALYRMHEYALAGIPVLPLIKGSLQTKWHMVGYTAAFAIAAYTVSSIQAGIGILWLSLAVAGFFINDTTKWARSMFIASLLVISLLAIR